MSSCRVARVRTRSDQPSILLIQHSRKEIAMRFPITCPAALLLASLFTLHAQEKTEPDFAAMSPDQVRQYELDVMRRIADLALIPPRLNTSPLPQYDYD